MIPMFDPDKLRGLLADFYTLTHIRITVFDEDLTEMVSYPDSVAAVCRVIRESEAGRRACGLCDKSACAMAAKDRSTHIYRCHAGLTEAVTPLVAGNKLVGYLLFGHVFSYETHEAGWQVIREACAIPGVDKDRLKKAVFSAEPVTEDYVVSASHILNAVASYLLLERLAAVKTDRGAARLDAFLAAHFAEPGCAAGAEKALGIGRTRLYELSKALYGCGVSARIRALRMEKAKELLAEGERSLAEIAASVGYADYNYFIAVFTRENGVSPGAWKKRV